MCDDVTFLRQTRDPQPSSAQAASEMTTHPNQLAFTDAVTSIFQAWTALKLAVDLDWGGPDSAEKRDWFVDTVVGQFNQKGKKLDAFDLEVILNQIMEDEFNVTLEDDSAYQVYVIFCDPPVTIVADRIVSQHIVKIYNECIQGDYTSVTLLREKLRSTAAGAVQASKATNDDSDDSESDDGEEGSSTSQNPNTDDDAMDVDTNMARLGPIIDKDGFELVTKPSKRKGRK
ncbi:Pre-rRNA-processing protein TSR2-domain-containing protein [Jimgerdemannia flammicorona]|uniref:Pre-rRNA-processing protein TSR2-domain-containing protein n=1 Tax=Jimgerdemannia flammicorona TaxID=994334 RepID=A0A433QEG2_9FUNG|nr:Pre-rRNA-processing protein TSR2-domain-containing protein [Jimgerdemannia flammicorona]